MIERAKNTAQPEPSGGSGPRFESGHSDRAATSAATLAATQPRVLVWFSCGAASAVATKLALSKYSQRVVIAYCDTGSEHPDNQRFLVDCEKWFDVPVVRLKSQRYRDTWDVWENRRFLVSPEGAPCTTELKKMVRFAFQRADDIQIFGYTAEERARSERFRALNFEVRLETPLIDAGLTKADCLAMVERAGIELPAMYRLGYRNNNCIGCVKGGIGYWNKIRRDFPEVFARMATLERRLGRTVLPVARGAFLDELDPSRGNHADEPDFECSLLCYMAEQDVRKGI